LTIIKKIQKICTKKLENLKLKPVFIENKDKKKTVYFKLKMTGKDIATDFYVDNKYKKAINGLDIVSKIGDLTPMIYLRSIYFGSHGDSEYNSSLQIIVTQAKIKEKQSNEPDYVLEDTDKKDDDDDEDAEESNILNFI